jgi:hypothetical protein
MRRAPVALPPAEISDEFAFAHRAVVNTDGLFRRLSCDADHQAILDVWWRSSYGVYVRFWGPNLLGENEALLLLALLARAGVLHRDRLRKAHSDARAAQADHLEWLNSAVATTVEVQTSLRQIAESVGLGSGGASLDAVRRSLERLGAVSVWTGRESLAKRTTMQNHQLIKVKLQADGSLCIALAPLLIDAMLGSRRNNTYVLLSSIVGMPASGYSRMLAIRLSWINPGERGEIGIARLSEYLWPGRIPTRFEKSKIRAALEVLGQHGWLVKPKEKPSHDVYEITRPMDAGLLAAKKRRVAPENLIPSVR